MNKFDGMEKLYTVKYVKVFNEVIGNDEEHGYKPFVIGKVDVCGKKMDVFFCENDKGIFVIAGVFRKGSPTRSCGHWHSGTLYVDVYFRKNFSKREDGNRFYKSVKTSMRID